MFIFVYQLKYATVTKMFQQLVEGVEYKKHIEDGGNRVLSFMYEYKK